MNTSHRFIIGGLTLVTLLCAGCQSSVNRVEKIDEGTPSEVTASRYTTDASLGSGLQIVRTDLVTLQNGLLQAQVTAVNTRTGFWSDIGSIFGSNTYRIRYKFQWLNQNGMEVPGLHATWETRVIEPGENAFFQAVSPSHDCKDFVFNIQETE